MATIDSKKLLPPSKESSAIEKPMFLVPVKSISVKKITGSDLKPVDKVGTDEPGSLVIVKKKIVSLSKIINNNLLLDQKEASIKRKEEEKSKREKKEKDLEKKVKKNNIKPDLIGSIPGQSIFDKINRFIGFTLLGYLFNQYGELLPKLMEFGKVLEPVGKFVEGFAKNILKGVVDFVEFGYKAYDQTRDFVKQIGGEGAEKTFDEFSKNLNLLLNGAIGAAMLIASTSPGKPGRPGAPGKMPGGKPSTLPKNAKLSGYLGRDPQTKLIERKYGNDAARMYEARKSQGASVSRARADVLKRFEKLEGPQRGLAGGTGSGGVFSRGLGKSANRAALKVLGKTGTKIAKGVFGRVPIVGGLIDFAFSLAMGENPGRAAAKAVGSTVGSVLGTFIPVPFAGTILGGILGDIVGGAMYDTLVGSNQKPQAKAQGGSVSRGGQSSVAPSRKLKTRPKKTAPKIQPQKTQPGKDVGGKLKLEELYGKEEPGKRSALRALRKSSEDVKKMTSLNGLSGAMFGAGIDMALGQKPDKKLAKSIGDVFGSVVQNAVNAELSSSFGDISKTIAMANGGVVPTREIGNGLSIGEKIGKFISNALAVSIEGSASKILQNLNREMNLEGGPDSGSDGGSMGPIEYGPLPLNMTQKQAFATIYELAKKHNASMPELVAAMAMNESGYLTSVLARQYNNPFGQTGSGTKGSTKIPGNSRTFAVYNSLSDAVKFHVEKWNNDSSYGKGAGTYASPVEGLRAILPTYDPGGNHSQYIKNASSILSTMGFDPQKKNPKADLSSQRLVQQRRSLPSGVIPGQQPSTGYKPSSPGNFNIIQYITGDPSQGSNYDLEEHGKPSNYHDHIAFKTKEDKERAKAALRAAGIKIGSEYRADGGYHGLNLAIDIPGYQWGGSGAIGQKEYEGSKRVRAVLGLGGGSSQPPRSRANQPSSQPSPPSRVSASPGTTFSSHGVNFFKGTDGKYYKMGRGGPVEIDKSTYDSNKRSTQVSLAPSQSSTVATLNSGILNENTGMVILTIKETQYQAIIQHTA